MNEVELLSNLVPILDAGVFGQHDAPFVRVGVVDRPDLADLSRVIESDGTEGIVAMSWMGLRDKRHIGLGVHIRRPAACTFSFLFDLGNDAHREALRRTFQLGILSVRTSRIMHVPGVNLRFDPEEVAALVDIVNTVAEE